MAGRSFGLTILKRLSFQRSLQKSRQLYSASTLWTNRFRHPCLNAGHMLKPNTPRGNTGKRAACSDNGLSEIEYNCVADETLDSLTEMFEDIAERLTSDPDYDVNYGSGVLTVKISASWGTYVINKQTPNKQIWLSSPCSGPKRYDFTDGVWEYKHDGTTMHDLLTEEISKALGAEVDFSECSYGSCR